MKGKEIWKDILGYEGKYQVSNRGNVKSLNYRRTGKEKILKGSDDGTGYLRVGLWKDGNAKECTIHRLVAQAFLPNPDNLPQINHKDEDKYNNCVENLEWCSSQYNMTYNDRAKKVGNKLSRPVIGINKVSGLIVEFASAHEASRQLGISQSNITQCCQGKYKSAGGYVWYYADIVA